MHATLHGDARRHGRATTTDPPQLGRPESQHRLRRGELVRVTHGVAVDGSAWHDASVRQRARIELEAVVTAVGEWRVLSHRSAALLWGLPDVGPTDGCTSRIPCSGRRTRADAWSGTRPTSRQRTPPPSTVGGHVAAADRRRPQQEHLVRERGRRARPRPARAAAHRRRTPSRLRVVALAEGHDTGETGTPVRGPTLRVARRVGQQGPDRGRRLPAPGPAAGVRPVPRRLLVAARRDRRRVRRSREVRRSGCRPTREGPGADPAAATGGASRRAVGVDGRPHPGRLQTVLRTAGLPTGA